MLKIIYAGTPEFAVSALEALSASEHRIVAVYTQPDRPAGRGRKLQQSPVKSCAQDHGLDVCQPNNFKSATDLEQIRAYDADLMVVAAYGLLLPSAVLHSPVLGCINIHASLLPRWRGASPIQQAILAGDDSSGVTLMNMDVGLDTGNVIARREITIDASWSSADLHNVLAPLGAELLMNNLDNIESAIQNAQIQNESLVTYAPRLSKSMAELDWNKPGDLLLREIRAFNPWPVSHTFLGQENFRIWSACISSNLSPEAPGKIVGHDNQGIYVSCADAVIQVLEMQFAGRNKCMAAQALNAGNLSGSFLGNRQ